MYFILSAAVLTFGSKRNSHAILVWTLKGKLSEKEFTDNFTVMTSRPTLPVRLHRACQCAASCTAVCLLKMLPMLTRKVIHFPER